MKASSQLTYLWFRSIWYSQLYYITLCSCYSESSGFPPHMVTTKIALGKIIKCVLSQKSRGLFFLFLFFFFNLCRFISLVTSVSHHTFLADHIFNYILSLYYNYYYYKYGYLLFPLLSQVWKWYNAFFFIILAFIFNPVYS